MKKVTLQFDTELQLVQFMYNRRFSWYHRDNEKLTVTCELEDYDIKHAEELFAAHVTYH